MLRYWRKLTVLIGAGALTTVLVAWASAIWVYPNWKYEIASGCTTTDDSGWLVHCFERPGSRYVLAFAIKDGQYVWQKGFLDDQLVPEEIHWPDALPFINEPSDFIRSRVIDMRGWPMLALWSDVSLGSSLKTYAGYGPDIGGAFAIKRAPIESLSYVASYATWDCVTIPYRPLWAGFVLDSVFFAAVYAGLWLMHRMLRRRMPVFTKARAAAFVAASCLLGILSTLFVVWICAVYVDEEFNERGPGDAFGESTNEADAEFGQWWLMRDQEEGAMRLISSWHSPNGGFFGSPPDGTVEEFLPAWAAEFLQPRRQADLQLVADARGWPILAMWGGFEMPTTNDHGMIIGRVGKRFHAIVLPNMSPGEARAEGARVIPLEPIWTGFLLDTLIYSAVWSAVLYMLAGPGIIRRTLRYRRNQCIQCGYDLRGSTSEKCPECGVTRLLP